MVTHMGILRQFAFSIVNSLKKNVVLLSELLSQMMLHLLREEKCLTEELSVFTSKDKGLTNNVTVGLRSGYSGTKAYSGETFYLVWSPSNHICFRELLI